MATENANKIKRLELENFTCFSKAAFDFSPGINVFIGENGTGKTHLLKVLYGGLNWKRTELREAVNWNMLSFVKVIPHYFGLENIENLVRKNGLGTSSKAIIELDIAKVSVNIGNENSNIKLSRDPDKNGKAIPEQLLYLTSQEMLSWYSGFSSLYNRREVSFDKTYYDLSEALGLPPLKNPEKEKAQKLISELNNELNLKVTKRDDKFFISWNSDNEFEASVVAQGINKLGQIIYLILNGSLDKDTILFWDEPESGLNPKYITVVTKFLLTLANAGCQVFVSTHDYLLTHQLSLFAENRDIEENVPPMKFFALSKGENGTEVEAADTVAEIQNNAILDEYAAYHELQIQIASKRFQTS